MIDQGSSEQISLSALMKGTVKPLSLPSIKPSVNRDRVLRRLQYVYNFVIKTAMISPISAHSTCEGCRSITIRGRLEITAMYLTLTILSSDCCSIFGASPALGCTPAQRDLIHLRSIPRSEHKYEQLTTVASLIRGMQLTAAQTYLDESVAEMRALKRRGQGLADRIELLKPVFDGLDTKGQLQRELAAHPLAVEIVMHDGEVRLGVPVT